MREIKFRAWDDIAKKMHYSSQEQFDDMLGFRFANFETDIPVYMQYTGLKDKNGKEIYESDILKASFSFIYIVEFLDGSYWLRDIKDNGRNYMHQTRMELFEIIGNIYGNPELIEGVQK